MAGLQGKQCRSRNNVDGGEEEEVARGGTGEARVHTHVDRGVVAVNTVEDPASSGPVRERRNSSIASTVATPRLRRRVRYELQHAVGVRLLAK